MRRALKRAARMLVAAGALGLSQPAWAQAPAAAPARQPSAGQAHLERMKVELAWMSDPVTFSHPLEAHVRGASLEVRGTLPDPGLKDHALRVARQHCFLPVVDGITVTASSAVVPAGAPDALEGTARRLLVRHLGPRATGFEVSAQPDGQVSVHGSVSSVEEKVTVSRCLRQVPGCTSVVNRL